MKRLITIITLLLALPSLAEVIPPILPANVGFSVQATNNSSIRAWAIVTARSANNGSPAVQYINAGSASNNVSFRFYKVEGAQTTVNYTNASTVVPITATNGFQANDVVIIRSLALDQYQRNTVVLGSTNLTLGATPSFVIAPGDIIYRVVSAATIQWGVSTNSLGPAPNIYIGQKGYPLLMEIEGNTPSASINVVSGVFLPP